MAAHGRTMIETCITMGIFALISTISAPQFRDIKRAIEVKNVAMALETHILNLPTLARLYQSDLSVRLIDKQIVTSTRQQPPQRIRVFNLPNNISIRIATSDQRLMVYTTNTLSPGRITLNTEHNQCSLIISLRGRVRRSC